MLTLYSKYSKFIFHVAIFSENLACLYRNICNELKAKCSLGARKISYTIKCVCKYLLQNLYSLFVTLIPLSGINCLIDKLQYMYMRKYLPYDWGELRSIVNYRSDVATSTNKPVSIYCPPIKSTRVNGVRCTINLSALFQGGAYIQPTINRPFRAVHPSRKFSPFDTRPIRVPRTGKNRREGQGVRERVLAMASARQWQPSAGIEALTPRDLRDVNEITRELVSDITDKLCPLPCPARENIASHESWTLGVAVPEWEKKFLIIFKSVSFHLNQGIISFALCICVKLYLHV